MHFNHWLQQRLPAPDKITALIQQAGSEGIPENQLRSQVDLPYELVSQLLAALIGARMVGVVVRGGKRVYFAR